MDVKQDTERQKARADHDALVPGRYGRIVRTTTGTFAGVEVVQVKAGETQRWWLGWFEHYHPQTAWRLARRRFGKALRRCAE